MKNEILDEPFYNSFSNYLEKGEQILWEDQSKKELLFSFNEIIPTAFFLFVIISSQNISFTFIIAFVFISFFMLSILIPKSKRIKRQKQTKYALTPKRIILQQFISKQIITDHIPLEDIARVSVETNHFNYRVGDIFILIKNDKKGLVKTYNPYLEQLNPVPTIWQINNPKEVLKLINEQIKKVKG